MTPSSTTGPTAAERANQYPDLPKVVYVCNCMAQGLLHDTYFYGRDTKQLVPTVVSPTEFFDGAIISGNCVSPGSKTTTYHHLRTTPSSRPCGPSTARS